MRRKRMPVSIEDAKSLIESNYTKIPESLAHLTKYQFGDEIDRQQFIKSAFLRGSGEQIILALLKELENKNATDTPTA